MKNLILICSCFGPGYTVNPDCENLMTNMARTIKEKFPRNTFHLISSSNPKAQKSADYVSKVLEVPISHTSDIFWAKPEDDPHGGKNRRELLEAFKKELLANQGDKDFVVLVTNLKYMYVVPWFLTYEWGQKAPWLNREQGAAIILYFEEERFEELYAQR